MRLLALIPPGTNARSLFVDMLRGMQLAGHEVLFEDVSLHVAAHQQTVQAIAASQPGPRKSTLEARLNFLRVTYARHLEHSFRARRCDAMIGLWIDPLMLLPMVPAAEGRRTSFIESLGIPMVHFWLDAPFWAYEGRLLSTLDRKTFTSPTHIHLVNNHETAAEMRRVLGFAYASGFSYGVDEEIFRPWAGIDREYDLAINAGPGDEAPTKTMLEQLGRDDPDVELIRRDQAWAARSMMLDVLRSFDEGKGPAGEALADALIDAQLADPDRGMLEKFETASSRASTPPELVLALTGVAQSPARWSRLTGALRKIEQWQRAFTAAYLSRHARCMIIGTPDASWQTAASAGGWEVRGDRAGNAGYHELALLYSRCRVGLNVMRYQDDVGLNPKVLEIASSGCVTLQRWRRGIDDLFADGTEVQTFRTPGQALHRLRELLQDPSRRETMGAAGRERVKQQHTWTVRAAELARLIAGR